MSKEDLTGQNFDRWTVKSYAGYKRRHRWNVECECGNKSVVSEYCLKKGLSRSCGCLSRDVSREVNTKHGETSRGKRSLEYRSFVRAKNSGIPFLFKSFEDFLKDVGRKPTSKHVLRRKKPAGNYEPGNIEWTLNRNRIRRNEKKKN